MERKTIEKCSFFPCFSIYFRSFLLFIWEKRFFFFSGNNLFLGEFFRIVSCLLGKHIFRRFFSRVIFFQEKFFFFCQEILCFSGEFYNFTGLQDFLVHLEKNNSERFFLLKENFSGMFLVKNFRRLFFFQYIFFCFSGDLSLFHQSLKKNQIQIFIFFYLFW